jgi:ParB/RepB/Spo0J family partition protein
LLDQIKLSSIVVRPEDYAFRDEDDLVASAESLKGLVDDIKAHGGVHTPVMVKKLPDGKYLLLDGHRRYFAMKALVEDEVFTDDVLLPANIVISEASEMALVARAVSANIQREPLSQEGRLRAVIRLHRLQMPRSEIARLVGKSLATIDRDIALASDEEMLDHVRERHISPTDAANLIKLAKEKGMLDEFKEMFRSWVKEVQDRLEREDEARAARDESSLSPIQRWPKRYLSTEQVKAWMAALREDLPFDEPVFRFKALLRDEDGRRRIEIDAVSMDVHKMSSKDLAKVMRRCLDLADEIEPVLLEKVDAETLAAERKGPPKRKSSGRDRLLELGLEELAGEFDEWYDEVDEEHQDAEENLAFPGPSSPIPPEGDAKETDEDGVAGSTATPQDLPPISVDVVGLIDGRAPPGGDEPAV